MRGVGESPSRTWRWCGGRVIGCLPTFSSWPWGSGFREVSRYQLLGRLGWRDDSFLTFQRCVSFLIWVVAVRWFPVGGWWVVGVFRFLAAGALYLREGILFFCLWWALVAAALGHLAAAAGAGCVVIAGHSSVTTRVF